MLVYEARFKKCDKVRIIVNFSREHDNYRIHRLRFERLYPELGSY
jgi:hypothetical protein